MEIDPLKAFAAVADEYDSVRPDYPPAAVERLVARFGLTRAASVVLDLAAGTGKLTRALLPHVAQVIAVEPIPEMRAVLAGTGAAVRAGVAEAIPLDAASADAVFVGDAFHWFDAPAALAEIARVVRPGGGLALLFNQAQWDDEPWMPALRAAIRRHRVPGRIRGNRRHWHLWRSAFERSPAWTPLVEETTDFAVTWTAAQTLAYAGSWSFIAALAPAARRAALDDIGAAIPPEPQRVPWRTTAFWTTRQNSGVPSSGVEACA